ncbi:TonB-dependent receptor domain-containing protein [Bacteroidota bacterium]
MIQSGEQVRTLFLSVAVLAAWCLPVQGQSGSISGSVVDAGNGNPVFGANAVVVSADSQRYSTHTNAQGRFVVTDLPVGTFALQISFIGYRDFLIEAIFLEDGQPRRIDVRLTPTVIYDDEIVVSSVSRLLEKAFDAPAGASVIQPRDVLARPVLTVGEHVKGMTAVDVVSTGLVQNRVAVRGFNNVIDYSDGLLLQTDYRRANFPSIRLNMFQLIPVINEDIERIEIVRGPGSALYGPNAANGMIHIVTKSPLTSQGSSIMFGLGERDVLTGSFRYASTIGDKLGFKVSGRYYQGEDWEFDDPAEPDSVIRGGQTPDGGADDGELVSNARDFRVDNGSIDGRLDYQANDDLRLTLSGGWARMTSINQTVIGAAFYKDAALVHMRGQLLYKDLFLQSYWNKGNLENGYLLRTGDQLIEKSDVLAGQVQHQTVLADGRQHFVYGADAYFTRPNTGYALNGTNENVVTVNEAGAYLQSETQLTSKLKFVGVLRGDRHSVIEDLVVSPRAAVVFEPLEGHSLRASFNRAFTTPANPALFLDLSLSPSLGTQSFPVRGLGLPATGFSYRRDTSGGVDGLYMQSPFNPAGLGSRIAADATLMWDAVVALLAADGIDISGVPAPSGRDVATDLALFNTGTSTFDAVEAVNITDILPPRATITNGVEIGYKGVLGSQLFFGLDAYYTSIQDRMGSLSAVTPSAFMDAPSLEAYLTGFMSEAEAANLTDAISAIPLGTVTPEETSEVAPAEIILSYRNSDEAINLWGIDVDLTYFASEKWRVRGTYSYVSEDLWPARGQQLEDMALNAPSHKIGGSVQYFDPVGRLDAQLSVRYVHGFPVRAGVYVGNVESYAVVDLNAGWGIPGVPQSKISVVIQNLLDNRHQEFVGSPEIGRLSLIQLSSTF